MIQKLKLLTCVYSFAILTATTAMDKDFDQPRLHSNGDKEIITFSNTATPQEALLSSSLCYNYSIYKSDYFTCSTRGPLLEFSYCATYNDDTKLLSLATCPYFQPNGHKVIHNQQIILPKNLSQLNDYMCGPMNRKGIVCSECADGFGPSVTSFGYRCVNCTGAWYGVLLFLSLEFVPITVFYLIILIFQINITSAPMPCFIMYAQFTVIAFDSNTSFNSRHRFLTKDWNFTLDMQIILTLYGLFNLDFCRYNTLPPYCVSSVLKPIHIASLGYISAFYPILLICLTWICIELHGHNFRPLVWLWRPFHRCFVRLRRGWDTKSDIIDVFTTFFLLSYSKIMYQAVLMIGIRVIINIPKIGRHYGTYQPLIDLSIGYGNWYHLGFVISSLIICLVFNILPSLLLTFYPIRAFRSCLSKCYLNSITVYMLTDKVYSCYRNGLDGGRDMRSFSGLYFYLRLVVYLLALLTHLLDNYFYFNKYFLYGTLFSITSLLIALAKPYKKPYMNHLGAMLLLNYALLSFVMSTGKQKIIARILLSLPIALFFLIIILKKSYAAITKVRRSNPKLLCACFKSMVINAERALETAAEPLIQPTSTVINYGADDNEVSVIAD